MKILKKILYFIINPLSTFGLGRSSDHVSKLFNKRKYLLYILAFIITVLIVGFNYFI